MATAIAIQVANLIAVALTRIAVSRLELPSGSSSLPMYDWMCEWPAHDLRYTVQYCTAKARMCSVLVQVAL
jgi:hypothetical protein